MSSKFVEIVTLQSHTWAWETKTSIWCKTWKKLPLLTLTNSHKFSIHNSLDEQCQVLAMAPAECGHPYGHKFRDSTSSAEMKQFNKASPGGEGQTVTYTCEDYVTCPCLRHLYMHALPLRHLYMHTHLPSFVCRHYIY